MVFAIASDTSSTADTYFGRPPGRHVLRTLDERYALSFCEVGGREDRLQIQGLTSNYGRNFQSNSEQDAISCTYSSCSTSTRTSVSPLKSGNRPGFKWTLCATRGNQGRKANGLEASSLDSEIDQTPTHRSALV